MDEIHLLGTDRGHIIEAVVDRMKAMPGTVRFVGLSTCLSNPLDVAEFLGVPKRGCYNFPSNMRSIPLRVFIRGFPGRHYCPRMAAMNKPLSDAIREYSNGKPTLVFVSSRKQTRLTALDLLAYANNRGEPFYYSTPETTLSSQKVKDPDLAHCLSFGIGLHHAGLGVQDCKIVEDLFSNGKMSLLIATSTLAWGVNLPAHFVVIKGTEYFDAKTSQYVPYSVTEMQQMMGRAGRPQFDVDGVVMILCEESRKDFLKRFINNPLPVESSLPENINDHVNAEIACGRIRTRKSLLAWLKRTYFAIRLEKNPGYYNDVTLEQVADNAIKELTLKHCCTTNIDGQIIPTPEGRIASIFYVSYKTVSLFVDRMNEANEIITLLRLICQSVEFEQVPVRHCDDDLISEMTPRFQTEDPPDSPFTKAFYLIQYHLSHRKMPVPDFETDLSLVLDQCLRIVGCFSEIAAIRGHLKAVMNAVTISQMLVQGIWYDQSPLEALVDRPTFQKLSSKNISILPQLLFDPQLPDNLMFIRDRVVIFKRKRMQFSTEKTAIKLTLEHVSGKIGSLVISSHFPRKEIQSIYIIVGDPKTGKLYAHRRLQLKKNVMVVTVQSKVPIPDDVWIYLMPDAYLGIDQIYPLSESQFAALPKATGKITETLPKFIKEVPKSKEPAPKRRRGDFVIERANIVKKPKTEEQKNQSAKERPKQPNRQRQPPKKAEEEEKPLYPPERVKRERRERGGYSGGERNERPQNRQESIQGIKIERPKRDDQPQTRRGGGQNYNARNPRTDDQRRPQRSKPRGRGGIDIR